MTRVVPSQIASHIETVLSEVLGQEGYQVDPQFADRVQAIIRLSDELPSELIALSGDDYNTYVGSIETLRNAVVQWTSGVRTEAYFHSRVGTAVRNLHKILKSLPDEQVPTATAQLSFIPDISLKDSIRRDIASTDQALHNGNWKAATVLAGATVEALLLWAVDQCSVVDRNKAIAKVLSSGALKTKPSKDLDNWVLNDLIEVSAQLGLIRDETAKQCRLAKNFRNLIHPGKSVRLEQECNRGTALSACAALEHVVVELTP
jgi:hypothetical protein